MWRCGLSPCLMHAGQALYHRATFSAPLFIEGFSACWQAHLGSSAKLFIQESWELSWKCRNSQLWANQHQECGLVAVTLPQNHCIQAWVEVGHLAWPKQDTIERTPSPRAHYGVVKRGKTIISSPFSQSISWASFSNMLDWEEGQATAQSSILVGRPARGPPNKLRVQPENASGRDIPVILSFKRETYIRKEGGGEGEEGGKGAEEGKRGDNAQSHEAGWSTMG